MNEGTVKLTVYSDYICPWCYVGQGLVERIQKDYGAEVDWRPVFLHPEFPQEGMRLPPHIQQQFSAMFSRIKTIADEIALPFVDVESFPNSRRALEASEYARAQNRHNEFHAIVFRKLWGEGQDINQWSVLRDAAQEALLDAGEMQLEIESGRYRAILDNELEKSKALRVEVVPTYILNDRYRIVGLQPFDVFRERIEKT